MTAEPDVARLSAVIEHLAALDRPSASAGEREAAEWLRDAFAAQGCAARVETETAHGTFWWPLGLLCAGAALAGLAAGRSERARGPAAVVGALAAAGIADDVSAGPHLLRRLLPRRSTFNVVAEAGDPSAAETLVFSAHHDAARGGFIFTPELVTVAADRFPGWFAKQQTSPQIMRLVAAGPALVALGALAGVEPLRKLGTLIAAGSTAAFADIGTRHVVPGANDNLSSVAVLVELARLLREEPGSGVRVLLVSTGSEESSMEGMRAFMRRHRASLAPARTRFICLESVGSPQLIVIEGEGMLKMRDYPAAMRDWLAARAQDAGTPLRRGLRLGLATDGLIALRAGYLTATLASVTEYKFPANYHTHRDVPRNLVYDTIVAATRVCLEAVRAGQAGRWPAG
jgi:hypothetical protein